MHIGLPSSQEDTKQKKEEKDDFAHVVEYFPM